MSMPAPKSRTPRYGYAAPRIAPPVPLQSEHRAYAAAAKAAGLRLFPWQGIASKYAMARDGKRFRYREVCITVARQNGKTTMLVPRILWGLEQGRRIVHTAQNRELPREAFMEVARVIDPNLLRRPPRLANGQERIEAVTGGSYKIIAPQKGVRGLSADDLIIDELREFVDFDFMAAARPILAASSDPQTIYLSNAGDDESVVLNALRESQADRLAYLEWSADPELERDDRDGWAQANPSLGHLPTLRAELEYAYETLPAERFDTEHRCVWVASMTAPLVRPADWEACRAGELSPPTRPSLGIALDPEGRRASAVLSWAQADGSYAVHPILEVSGPLNVDELGPHLRREAVRQRARQIAFSGTTDVALARYLPAAKALDGRMYANASATFAQLAEGHQLRWVDGDAIGEDLHNVIRKPVADGAVAAVRNGDEPATAALAAIRAVWLASAPRQVPRIG
jgi:hypothetical protein